MKDLPFSSYLYSPRRARGGGTTRTICGYFFGSPWAWLGKLEASLGQAPTVLLVLALGTQIWEEKGSECLILAWPNCIPRPEKNFNHGSAYPCLENVHLGEPTTGRSRTKKTPGPLKVVVSSTEFKAFFASHFDVPRQYLRLSE